jgi:hypothetical protein
MFADGLRSRINAFVYSDNPRYLMRTALRSSIVSARVFSSYDLGFSGLRKHNHVGREKLFPAWLTLRFFFQTAFLTIPNANLK